MPTALRGIDPIYQVKATELANGLMNEIMGKRLMKKVTPAAVLFGVTNLNSDVICLMTVNVPAR